MAEAKYRNLRWMFGNIDANVTGGLSTWHHDPHVVAILPATIPYSVERHAKKAVLIEADPIRVARALYG
jgi:hypothetical protein